MALRPAIPHLDDIPSRLVSARRTPRREPKTAAVIATAAVTEATGTTETATEDVTAIAIATVAERRRRTDPAIVKKLTNGNATARAIARTATAKNATAKSAMESVAVMLRMMLATTRRDAVVSRRSVVAVRNQAEVAAS